MNNRKNVYFILLSSLGTICFLNQIINLSIINVEGAETSVANNNDELLIDKTVVSGWKEVTKKWPLDAQEFFITGEDKHSYVSVELPEKLETDLEVKLVFFYNFVKNRPFVQIVPCRLNVDVINDNNKAEEPLEVGKWHEKTWTVKASDCAVRNELAFNVILHDIGDVFAWNFLEIKSVLESNDPPADQNQTPATDPPADSNQTPAPDPPADSNQTPKPNPLVDSNQTPPPQSVSGTEPVTSPAPGTVVTDRPQAGGEDKPDTNISNQQPVDDTNKPSENNQPEEENKQLENENKPVEDQNKPIDQNGENKPPSGEDEQNKPEPEKVPEKTPEDNNKPPEEENKQPDQNNNQPSPPSDDTSQDESKPQVDNNKSPENQEENKNAHENTSQGELSRLESIKNKMNSLLPNKKGLLNNHENASQGELSKLESIENEMKLLSNKKGLLNNHENALQGALSEFESIKNEMKLLSNKKGLLNNHGKSKKLIKREVIHNYKRTLGNFLQNANRHQQITATCRPVLCDRELFKTKNFLIFPKGLPTLPGSDILDSKSFWLNKNNLPINFIAESSEDFTEVNTCVDLQYYLDAGTRLDFFVEDNSKQRLLETVERSEMFTGNEISSFNFSGDYWKTFRRCIDDYMPRLNLPRNNNNDWKGDKHKLKLSFVPHNTGQGGKQVAILGDVEKAISLKKLYPNHDYIPNIKEFSDIKDFHKYWILDGRHSVDKGFRFKTEAKLENVPATETGDNKNDEDPRVGKNIKISVIDPRSETFDITSRWIKIDDVETFQNALLFMYRANKINWIDSIEFQHQSSLDANNDWYSEKVYIAPRQQAQPASDTTVQNQPLNSSSPSPSSSEVQQQPKPDDIADNLLFPRQLKGLTTDEFRLRIRHHIKEEVRKTTSIMPLELTINTLSFGDLCSESLYCNNRGKCKPKGPAQAKCICRQGFSGERCEISKPCEAIYNGKTGKELCESIGAKCVEGLPFFRCLWPNNAHYQCNVSNDGKLPTTGIDGGNSSPPTSPPNNNNNDANDNQPIVLPSTEVEQLKEKTNSQAQLIIILAVFMVAILLFLVVIVINLVNRLMKSKKQLTEARSEVHELARRSQPSGSGVSLGGGPFTGRPMIGRLQKPATGINTGMPATISYNNQSFDAD